MEMNECVPGQWLYYDFWYEGVRHRNKVWLEEDAPGVELLYDDHDIEITWLKHIRHKGKHMEINIVLNDDAYSPDEGKVVASAWVCVYSLTDSRTPIAQFEPDDWAYIDESNPSNSVSKGTFYTEL